MHDHVKFLLVLVSSILRLLLMIQFHVLMSSFEQLVLTFHIIPFILHLIHLDLQLIGGSFVGSLNLLSCLHLEDVQLHGTHRRGLDLFILFLPSLYLLCQPIDLLLMFFLLLPLCPDLIEQLLL